jgi:hypothetical protein
MTLWRHSTKVRRLRAGWVRVLRGDPITLMLVAARLELSRFAGEV